MKWTPLHAALGLEATEITFEIVALTIAEAVAETQDLDFKRDLPLPPGLSREAKEAKQAELAKDVAAMANAGGGMLLYGMDEDRTSTCSVAKEICSVGEFDEKVEKQIRQVVAALVYPAVRNLEFAWLTEAAPAEGAEPRSVLALQVPDSVERPHLVHPRAQPDWFSAPYRDGADTAFMTDRMLSSAYIDRERGERRVEQTFEDRFADLLSQVPGDGWIVVMAMPERSAGHVEQFERWDADEVFRRGLTSRGGRFSAASELGGTETRIGLRRYSRRREYEVRPPVGEARFRLGAYSELHADGTVALALSRGGYFPTFSGVAQRVEATHIALGDLRSTMEDFAQLLCAMRQARTAVGPYRARLMIHPYVSHFRRDESHGVDAFMELYSARDSVRGYRPIESRLTDGRGDLSLLESIQDMIEDAFAQAGAPAPPRADAEIQLKEFNFVTRRL